MRKLSACKLPTHIVSEHLIDSCYLIFVITLSRKLETTLDLLVEYKLKIICILLHVADPRLYSMFQTIKQNNIFQMSLRVFALSRSNFHSFCICEADILLSCA